VPWDKVGRIFEAGGAGFMRSHAALPVAESLGDRVRVYFSSRDEAGRAQVGAFVFDPAQPSRIVEVSPAPLIGLGPLGAFDDSGVTSSWAVSHGGRVYHYYSGWSLGVTVPFYFYVGLALSEDGGRSFRRVSRGPILERDDVDPYLTASPCVLVEEGRWRMWYVSGTGWQTLEGRPRHAYHIKYAESADGVRWQRRGHVCIDYASADEYAIARPSVVRDGERYRMWFCCRGESYRLGYAESPDGLRWERRDEEAGLDVSPAGWDSEMIAYPHVFDHDGRRYMLYNGNRYGESGIGLAVWRS
jgi:hypothetical protein